MKSPKLTLVVLLLLFCATMTNAQTPFAAKACTKLEYCNAIMSLPATSNDWRRLASGLQANIENDILTYNRSMQDAKDGTTISSGVATMLSLIGAAIIGSSDSDTTRKHVGLATSIVSAAIGLYQVIQGVKGGPAEYVNNANALLRNWNTAALKATNDEDLQKAYATFSSGAYDLQKSSYAHFTIPSPVDLNLEKKTPTPEPNPKPGPTPSPSPDK
ncbi:MAG: hypothetical protein ABFD49_02065 [Armatimonadota bacterium]|nr:hypothetical protein [bacterium]